MSYGTGYQQIHQFRRELKEHYHWIKNLESKLIVSDTELDVMKMKLDAAVEELAEAKRTAEKVTQSHFS